jgi:hypothetical protein
VTFKQQLLAPHRQLLKELTIQTERRPHFVGSPQTMTCQLLLFNDMIAFSAKNSITAKHPTKRIAKVLF